MPSALLRPCPGDGGRCPELVESGACPKHRSQADRRRGSAASRGYTARWAAFSRQFRTRFPLCGMRPTGAPATTDSVCQQENRATAAQVTDHIVPVDGPNDPRFFDETNMQALCHVCHNAKRQRERRS